MTIERSGPGPQRTGAANALASLAAICLAALLGGTALAVDESAQKVPAAAKKAPAPAVPAGKASAPSLQFVGTAAGEDGRVVYFLTDGDELLSVTQGDLVRGDYRVDGVVEGETLTLTRLKTQDKLRLAPHAGPAPASNAGRPQSEPDSEAGTKPRRRARDDE